MRIPEANLDGLGMPGGGGDPPRNRIMAELLHSMGNKTYQWARPVLALTVLASVGAAYGISRIVINDNPIQ